jgi:hypothetical protein
MTGIPPLQNQDNAYRSEVAGTQMAAEQKKEEVSAKDKLDKTKALYDSKLNKVQDVEKVEALREDEAENHKKKKHNQTKSLNGGSFLDTVAD